MDQEAFGQRLKDARNQKRKTQAQVCELLAISQPQVLSAYETGKNLPSIDTLVRLSEIYEVSVDWLLYGKVETRKKRTPRDYAIQLVEAMDYLGIDIHIETDEFGKHEYVVSQLSYTGYQDFNAFAFRWAKFRTLRSNKDIEESEYMTLLGNRLESLQMGVAPTVSTNLVDEYEENAT